MNKIRNAAFRVLCASLLIFGYGGETQAALHNRGGGMIYDDVLDITWLWDANYAKTSGYDSDGLMNWYEAMAWVEQLNYGGYNDWRLPSALNKEGLAPDALGCSSLVDCPDSELGYMFHVNYGFGVDNPVTSADKIPAAPSSPPYKLINNMGLFTNVMAFHYWFGTEHAVYTTNAWFFWFDDVGYPIYLPKDMNEVGQRPQPRYAWAVRDGDVEPVPPLPEVNINSISCSNGIITVGGSGFGNYNNTAGSGTTIIDINDSELCTVQSWTDTAITADCGFPVNGSIKIDSIYSSATAEVEGCKSSGRPKWWEMWSWWSSWSWSRR